MRALEMEADEDEAALERETFLDPDDRALGNGSGRGSGRGRGVAVAVASETPSFFATPNGKLASSFAMIVVIVLVFSGVAPDGGGGEFGSGGSGEGWPGGVPAPQGSGGAGPSTPSSAAYVNSLSTSRVANNPNRSTELVYSNYATIVPDPDVAEPPAERLEALQQTWGRWKFWDGEEADRPTGDYCAAFPDRDIPGDQFPDMAWQADAVFVNHYLDAAEQLVGRAKEAIFTEYGHGKPLPPEGLAERLKMFHWEKLADLRGGYPFAKSGGTGHPDQGGWTTRRSFQGLVRRLLHAMMTNDKFTVVLAGHSAAAGHGNHFHQSYAHQMHRILSPIFARLGVQLVTRNQAMGGLGTLPLALGFADMYGDAVDLVLWDSGMTEGKEAFDLFARQALLSGKKVPVIWAAQGSYFEVLQRLHDEAEVDVGEWGSGMAGILKTTSDAQAQTLPKAVRYMSCENGAEEICKSAERFCASCWLRRDLNPKKLGFGDIRQSKDIGGQVRWHPGWRAHQLTGRVLAFALLDALQEAIQQWSDGTMGGPPLDDAFWHVSAYYENIRNKVKNLNTGLCFDGGWNRRACTEALHARGEYTPRVNPSQSSLTSIVRPAADGYKPAVLKQVLYGGPDGPNPCYEIKAEDIDTLAIVSGRRVLLEGRPKSPEANQFNVEKRRRVSDIEPGKGWEIVDEKPGLCDGDYYSICGRSADDDCPALAHHDSRGAIVGNEFAGWIVLEIPEITKGLLMLRFVSYLQNPRTQDWTTVNNERRLRSGSNTTLSISHHSLDFYDAEDPFSNQDTGRQLILEDFPDTTKFEYSINGAVTTLTKEEFLQRRTVPQRVTELITLLDDPNFSGTNVELAIRLRDCGHDCTIGLTHLYWV